ncbi:hypothetical protein K439DRAFT_1644834 [Ramaria rubella]|nr:hypothetical protein K439DRAFT_1644834 [Ramaria rubella]
MQTAILLNRSPMLSHPPTPFEAAFQEYNAHIARAISNPFPREFYFKPGSVLEAQFRQEDRKREKDAFNWGSRISRWRALKPRERSKKQVDLSGGATAGILAKEETEIIMPRITEADKKGDIQSLDRKGHRNLYLLVKKSKGRDAWRLPGGISEVKDGELLHEAAQRELHAECGVNIDAWIVGRHPIGFMDESNAALLAQYAGCKTFFFKAHIMAGQVDPSAGSLADFAWLTKGEIKRAVTSDYWTNIQDILSDF